MCIFAIDFNGEITKRYARSADRNLGNSIALQNMCNSCAFQRGLTPSSQCKVIPRTSIRRRVYSTTLLLCIMLNGVRKSFYLQGIMNKYIEDYIAQRKKELAEEKLRTNEAEKAGLLDRLQIGKREYRDDFPNEAFDNFPYYDNLKGKHYRYNVGEVSDEDYAELLKYVPSKDIPSVNSANKIGGWYTFGVIMMIIGCIGGIVVGSETESAVVAICIIIGVLAFFSQIVLLSKIEFNTRSKQSDIL